MGAPQLFVSAGDPSGDNATSRVLAILKERQPELHVFGLGGRRMKKLGQEQLAAPKDLAVLGFWEVARRYLFFRRLFYRCLDEIKSRRPAAVLLVDYPGFNLRLAKRLHGLDIPIIYYISPQVWAWGGKRLKQIQQYVDLMLPILPFEVPFYKDAGVKTEFVGHYLVEDIPGEYISSPSPGRNRLALLPGSRSQEIERMLPSMVAAARALHRKHGITATIAGVEDTVDYETFLRGDDREFISVVLEDSRRVIYESDYVITASGTATLETGIIGRPMVIVYKTGFVTYQIAKRLVTLDTIGLVNLVLGEKAVPELIQGEANGSTMAAAVEKYIVDAAYRETVTRKLSGVPERLGGEGASERTAAVIERYL